MIGIQSSPNGLFVHRTLTNKLAKVQHYNDIIGGVFVDGSVWMIAK